MDIQKSNIDEDNKIILAWMKEHETILASKGNIIYIALGDNLVEVVGDFQNMTTNEIADRLEAVLYGIIELETK